MKFNRLRILGFKTFVEATDVPIEPGLTGIVGPNGCGKSNLVEAMRWVMGENSFRNMRASGMDDVIFSGSGGRPARNTAEVMLTVDNRERRAPAPFNDHELLEVSRRIEREAGSVYRINGREVRARDVQLLFADASSGARSPAMVRQGQIGEIINAKPQARRRILEEAAGIAGLYARRNEAEQRLVGAETNLERLETVLAQIDGQVEALKRQARSAVRYRALSADIRRAEASIAALKFREAGEGARRAEADVMREAALVAERTQAQAEAAKNQAVAAHHLPDLREAATRAGAALQRLVAARAELDGEEKRSRERLAEIDLRIAQMRQDIERADALVLDADSVLERLAREREALVAEATAAASATEEAREASIAAEAALKDREAALGVVRSAVAERQARRSSFERALAEASTRSQRLARESEAIGAERARLEREGDHKARREALAGRIEAALAARAAAETEALAAEQAHAVARSQEAEARRPLADADRAAQRLDTEIRTLAKLLNVANRSLWPPIVEAVTVAKGFETALGAALGDDLDAPADAASPQHWAGAAIGDDPTLPEGVIALSIHVTAPAALARRLAQIGLVKRADGARLAAFLKTGQRLVSKEGDLWRWDGFVVAANAPTAAARRLAERNRMGDLERDAAKAKARVDELKRLADAAAQTLKVALARETTAREAARQAARAHDGLRDEQTALDRASAAVVSRLAALAEADKRLAGDRLEAAASESAARDGLAALGDGAETAAALAAAEVAVQHDRASSAEARARSQALAMEADQRRRRIEAIVADAEAWTKRAANAGGQTADLRKRLQDAEAERLVLEEAPDTFGERRRALMSAIADAEAAQKAASDLLVAGERSLSEADKAARAALEAMAGAREGLARAEARLEAERRRQDEIAAEIREAFEVEPHALVRIAGAAESGELPPLSLIEEALDRLKRERERLGAVNLRADEELTEVQTRFDGMVAERDELVEAIRKLRGAIQSLNREGRERLVASFAAVNANFERLFTTLFAGGTAELQLIESDDPLEAGLDILAKPPGKKPQTLSLLSGGEQALTAIALIFAVFLTNPAPICVLDEVDAPLDDANVERFCDMLDQMAAATETRFLVITHNPITMSRMNRLFGVTMAERGVSTLVSVDLERAERLLAAE